MNSLAKSAVSGFESFDDGDVDDSSGVHKKHMAPSAPNDYMMHIS